MSDRASSSSATALFAVGPPSPASPATGFLKETHHPSYLSSDQQTQQTPQTPTSPPLMSVSAQSHASSNNFTSSQASPSHATAQHPAPPANLSSPPSSVPMSSQVSQQPTVTSSATNSFPTPASSVNDHMGGIESEQTDKLMGVGAAPAPAPAPATAEYTRTDHDRQPLGGTDPGSGVRDFANRPDDDAMDIDRKAEMVGNSNSGFGLDSLQREFASAYHLCKSCKSFPNFNPPKAAAACTMHFYLNVFWD